jgi:hypothetical protein
VKELPFYDFHPELAHKVSPVGIERSNIIVYLPVDSRFYGNDMNVLLYLKLNDENMKWR